MRSIRGSSRGWALLRSKAKPKKQVQMKCYAKRNDLLATLGYASYAEYLQSDQWRGLRQRIVRRFPNCLLCDADAVDVHHLDYQVDTLLGRRQHRLVPLCRYHHHQIEFDGNRKRDVRQATGALCKLAETASDRSRNWLAALSQKEADYRRRKRRAKRAQTRSKPTKVKAPE